MRFTYSLSFTALNKEERIYHRMIWSLNQTVRKCAINKHFTVSKSVAGQFKNVRRNR